ncbi:dephospho-CoA kinase [uncultured Treponema sp.]|uniref:dephospho-CoA kinase n=1 Tax=uncultured Treponema sp. TaxID=162155 RepID=UPI0025FAEFC7|nr:dephospho-CoA kinase [uncultured Treponema sp.]
MKLKIENGKLKVSDIGRGFCPASGSLPICVTGQMAAGKNFVCSLFEKEGFVSLDLDKTAHEAISLCKAQILSGFGEIAREKGISLLKEDGSLDRRELGRLVFSSPELLARQESIVYPKIIELTNQFIENNSGKPVILNATVLFKTPELLAKCGKIFFVKANFLKRLARAKKRDGLPLRQILARFKSQKNLFREYKKAASELNIPIEIIRN